MYCYGGAVFDNQRQTDVPATMEGIKTCRDACVTAGFSLFGFECPLDFGGTTMMHCECGDHSVHTAVHITANENCRQYNEAFDRSVSACQAGPSGNFIISGDLGTYYLGAHGYSSAFETNFSNFTS